MLAHPDTGSGPPLVLIPGVGQQAWHWRPVVSRLASSFRCIAVSNRGFGGSFMAPPPWTTRELARDVLDTLDALGVPRAVVVGHSLGGLVAQELALAAPERVARLVLVSTSPGGAAAIPVEPEALAVMLQRDGDAETLFRRGLAVSTAPGWAERHPAAVREMLDFRLANPVNSAAYAAQVLAGAGHDASLRLGALRCATLVVTGDRDRVVPPANADVLARLIPGARVQVIAGAGHLVPWEAPDDLAELIRDAQPDPMVASP